MIALAVIVLVGTLFGAYQRSQDPRLGGVAGLFCPPKELGSHELMTGSLGFFIYVFHLSKYVELVDTFILIAKGKPVIFLHCYHHCSMLFVTWSWFAFPWLEGAWWCAVVNSIIHSFMYYYYFRTAIPDTKIWWGKYLTSAQIVQVRPPAARATALQPPHPHPTPLHFHPFTLPSSTLTRAALNCPFTPVCSFSLAWWWLPTLFTSETAPGTSAPRCFPPPSTCLSSRCSSCSIARSTTKTQRHAAKALRREAVPNKRKKARRSRH
jgi:hypothetical protein